MEELINMTFEQLVDAAVSASHSVNSAWNRNEFDASEAADKHLDALLSEARRRDMLPATWPSGPDAADRLAEEWVHVLEWVIPFKVFNELCEDIANESLNKAVAAVVLARLQHPEETNDA